jgi:hypothetical protein
MTDVLDRRSSVELDEIEGVTPSSPPGGVDVSVFGRAALASLLVGAAVIHLVMVSSHLDEWTAEGAAFLVAGWMQILLAVDDALDDPEQPGHRVPSRIRVRRV